MERGGAGTGKGLGVEVDAAQRWSLSRVRRIREKGKKWKPSAGCQRPSRVRRRAGHGNGGLASGVRAQTG